jgi:heptosyltransferase III
MTLPPSPRLVCLISARNLGDAVGHANVLLDLARNAFSPRFLVWTKPEAKFLFAHIPNCDVVTSPFPIGTGKRFRLSDVFRLLASAAEVRRRRPDLTLDVVGDQRERWLARIAGSSRHVHIGWAKDHPFRRLIRNPFGPGRPVVTIPAEEPNVYEAHRLFVQALCIDQGHLGSQERSRRPGPLRIGLHPFASQECKFWPNTRWQELVCELHSQGHTLFAFCAPAELEQLKRNLGLHQDKLALVARSLGDFDSEVSGLDLMIGLDSFAVHLAHRHGVRTIMLNAGNPSSLWKAPRGRVLGDGGGCVHFPCYNVPRCTREARFVCVRSITVAQVLDAVEEVADHVV